MLLDGGNERVDAGYEGIGLLRCALCIRRGQGGPLGLQAGPVALHGLECLQRSWIVRHKQWAGGVALA